MIEYGQRNQIKFNTIGKVGTKMSLGLGRTTPPPDDDSFWEYVKEIFQGNRGWPKIGIIALVAVATTFLALVVSLPFTGLTTWWKSNMVTVAEALAGFLVLVALWIFRKKISKHDMEAAAILGTILAIIGLWKEPGYLSYMVAGFISLGVMVVIRKWLKRNWEGALAFILFAAVIGAWIKYPEARTWIVGAFATSSILVFLILVPKWMAQGDVDRRRTLTWRAVGGLVVIGLVSWAIIAGINLVNRPKSEPTKATEQTVPPEPTPPAAATPPESPPPAEKKEEEKAATETEPTPPTPEEKEKVAPPPSDATPTPEQVTQQLNDALAGKSNCKDFLAALRAAKKLEPRAYPSIRRNLMKKVPAGCTVPADLTADDTPSPAEPRRETTTRIPRREEAEPQPEPRNEDFGVCEDVTPSDFEADNPDEIKVILREDCFIGPIRFPASWTRGWTFNSKGGTGWVIIKPLETGLMTTPQISLDQPSKAGILNGHSRRGKRAEYLRGKGTIVFRPNSI